MNEKVKAVCVVQSHGLLQKAMRGGVDAKVPDDQPRATFSAKVLVKYSCDSGPQEFTMRVKLPLGGGKEIRSALVDVVKAELVRRGLEQDTDGKVIIT